MAQTSRDGAASGTDTFASILNAAETATLRNMTKELEKVEFKNELNAFTLSTVNVLRQEEEDELHDIRASRARSKRLMEILIERSERPRKKAKLSAFDALIDVLKKKNRECLAGMLYLDREAKCAELRAQQDGQPPEDNSSDDDMDVRPGETVYFDNAQQTRMKNVEDDDKEQPPPI